MRNDLSDITVVMDRSGSMSAIQSDAEGGLNQFIKSQKELAGDAVFTLVQFDTDYEFVHRGLPIKDVPHCDLVPRGATALLDAVGRAIVETGERLSKMDEKDRPGLVVFVILTDGRENSSHEFTKAKVKELVEKQQNIYKWQFTYLGANVDAFAEAAGMGIKTSGTAGFSLAASPQAFAGASATVGRMRAAARSSQPIPCGYTDKERKAMKS